VPKVPFLPEDTSEPADVVAAVRARRKGGALSILDRILLHSPAVTAGWSAMFKAIRTELSIDAFHRELCMLVPLVILRGDLEIRIDGDLFRELGGTDAQITALAKAGLGDFDAGLFTPEQAAIARFAGEVTRRGRASDATFEAARAVVGTDQKVVELVATVGAYNLVSQFVATLDIDDETRGYIPSGLA